MPGNEGLCSWPSTPLHDPINHGGASPHMSQGGSDTRITHRAGMRKSLNKIKVGQADRLVTFSHGERLIFA